MKRDRALVAFLAIFLILVMNPSPYIDSFTIGNEHQEANFLTADDGDESSESLTSFSPTLDEDVLFYPDAFPNNTLQEIASEDDFDVGGGAYDYDPFSYAMEMDALYWRSKVDNGIGHLYINFSNPHGDELDSLDYAIYTYGGLTITLWQMWDYVDSAWDTIEDIDHGASLQWHNATISDHNYFSSTLMFRIYWTAPWDLLFQVIGYAEITCKTYMTLAGSGHYAESFADVSDWTGAGGIASDGDLGYYDIPDDSSYPIVYTNTPSFTTGVGYYLEVRMHANASCGGRVRGFSADDRGGTLTFQSEYWYPSTSGYVTKKWYIPNMDTYTEGAIESFVLYFKASVAVRLYIDYARIGPADEMGWAHDGSTTAAITEVTKTGWAYAESTDGDLLNITMTRSGGTANWGEVFIDYDSTATEADLERDYYPFLEMKFSVPSIDERDFLIMAYIDGKYGTVGDFWGVQAEQTVTVNTAPFTDNAGATKGVRIIWYCYTTGSATILIDYVKAYSIANHTVTQSGAGTDDYLYVDSGVLYSTIDDGYIELNHDPALSVSDTYPVWNLTTGSTAPQFSDYVSSWSSYSSETRGALQSGTVTDTKLRFTADGDISAIKFISDSTAPDADIVVSPNPPGDDEQVTLSSIIFDDVEVWKVWYNAISYPTGFNDVDYEATEGQENYWSYSFSSLIAGDYCFKVIANDGANNSTVTESNRDYATVRFTVREPEITITTYTLIGASSDFDYMHYSFYISRDCTFIIEEWSDTWAKNETHTGSVSKGDRAIAWDKIGVNDINANYTITFTNGSLTKVIDGGYLTAYKALQVTEIDFVNLEQSDNWATNLTINFYTNKEVDWYVYDVDDSDTVLHSGTTTEGDGFITWVKNNARGAHQFAVKWEDGVSEQFYNNSYWIYERNIDDLPGGADPGADQRRTIEFWATVAGIAGVLGIMVIGLSHYNLDEKIKNLPNYRTQERGRR